MVRVKRWQNKSQEEEMSDDPKTIYELKEIIERCFKECEEAGFIRFIGFHHEGKEFPPTFVLVNPGGVADHISKTIIGELMEFEVLRKLAPMFRTFRSIEANMKYLDDKQTFQSQLPGIRIEPK
jgi:hypothetical protein